MTHDHQSKPTTNTPLNRGHLLREAARRGTPSWASPNTDGLLRTTLWLRVIGVVGATLITGTIGALVLWLLGVSL
jgi:hypothetical protein